MCLGRLLRYVGWQRICLQIGVLLKWQFRLTVGVFHHMVTNTFLRHSLTLNHGHGLASENGEEMYLLPYDGRPRLLNETAISRERLFADISAANPRSVTVFLDTCYSGTTRGTDMLIASRPIAMGRDAMSISVPRVVPE